MTRLDPTSSAQAHTTQGFHSIFAAPLALALVGLPLALQQGAEPQQDTPAGALQAWISGHTDSSQAAPSALVSGAAAEDDASAFVVERLLGGDDERCCDHECKPERKADVWIRKGEERDLRFGLPRAIQEDSQRIRIGGGDEAEVEVRVKVVGPEGRLLHIGGDDHAAPHRPHDAKNLFGRLHTSHDGDGDAQVFVWSSEGPGANAPKIVQRFVEHGDGAEAHAQHDGGQGNAQFWTSDDGDGDAQVFVWSSEGPGANAPKFVQRFVEHGDGAEAHAQHDGGQGNVQFWTSDDEEGDSQFRFRRVIVGPDGEQDVFETSDPREVHTFWRSDEEGGRFPGIFQVETKPNLRIVRKRDGGSTFERILPQQDSGDCKCGDAREVEIEVEVEEAGDDDAHGFHGLSFGGGNSNGVFEFRVDAEGDANLPGLVRGMLSDGEGLHEVILRGQNAFQGKASNVFTFPGKASGGDSIQLRTPHKGIFVQDDGATLELPDFSSMDVDAILEWAQSQDGAKIQVQTNALETEAPATDSKAPRADQASQDIVIL